MPRQSTDSGMVEKLGYRNIASDEFLKFLLDLDDEQGMPTQFEKGFIVSHMIHFQRILPDCRNCRSELPGRGHPPDITLLPPVLLVLKQHFAGQVPLDVLLPQLPPLNLTNRGFREILPAQPHDRMRVQPDRSIHLGPDFSRHFLSNIRIHLIRVDEDHELIGLRLLGPDSHCCSIALGYPLHRFYNPFDFMAEEVQSIDNDHILEAPGNVQLAVLNVGQIARVHPTILGEQPLIRCRVIVVSAEYCLPLQLKLPLNPFRNHLACLIHDAHGGTWITTSQTHKRLIPGQRISHQSR
ncbi:MAG: hypothetical protein BWY82_01398 [Verrucomicrobia bacterium ADurb.Bin474]|nr:MAG: hypothetical protein BWY82_01398 [Verrucomicrobia bacterium ADurb.Bin474]